MEKGKWVLVAFIWVFFALVGSVIFKAVISPRMKEAAKDKAKQEETEKLRQTAATSRYSHQLNFALDSFSGYAIFRSPQFEKELAERKIKLNLIDSNYKDRFEALSKNEVQMGVFTIDAAIKAMTPKYPISILAIVDETTGADAIVSYKELNNIDDLNIPEMKLVLTPDSPSETLARVIISKFGLNQLSENSFVKVNDAKEVYEMYRKSKPEDKMVYILWQPYVSKILDNPNTHILVDSSRVKGYIVDVIVANRDFLVKNREVAKSVLEAYFSALYHYKDNMVQLVLDDSKITGVPVSRTQSEALVNGIWWKNTQENYNHFGLAESNNQHIEDMIINITKVLKSTNAISDDITNNRPNLLYYDQLLKEMHTGSFHPGKETVREDSKNFVELSDDEWKKLVKVGTLEVPPLVFARGTSNMTASSEAGLEQLVKTLQSFPQYYVTVTGNASTKGNMDANKKLALSRAKAVEKHLVEHGVNKNRIKATGSEPSGTNTSVTFTLKQSEF